MSFSDYGYVFHLQKISSRTNTQRPAPSPRTSPDPSTQRIAWWSLHPARERRNSPRNPTLLAAQLSKCGDEVSQIFIWHNVCIEVLPLAAANPKINVASLGNKTKISCPKANDLCTFDPVLWPQPLNCLDSGVSAET